MYVRPVPQPLLLLKAAEPASKNEQGDTPMGRIPVPHPGLAGGLAMATASAAAVRLPMPSRFRNDVGTVVVNRHRTALTWEPSRDGVNAPLFQMPSTMFPFA